MATSNILSLEAEVLANVLRYIDDESPWTTAAVAQTCKYLNYVSKLVRYRRLTVRWDSELRTWTDQSGRRQEEWETPELLQGLRQLTVRQPDIDPLIGESDDNGDSSYLGKSHHTFDRLETVLRNASNLKTVVWNAGYLPTKGVVEALQAHQPNAKLDIYRGKRLSNLHTPLESEEVLAAATCLNSFSMRTQKHTCIEDHLLFHMILSSAPNLRFASIISYPSMAPYSPQVTNLRYNLESWLPPDQGRKPSSSLRHLTLDGWEISADCLEFWSQYVNLACLTSLKCSRGPLHQSYFERGPQMLTNLKSLSINLAATPRTDTFLTAAQNYIATCPPLETLSLWSWRGKMSLRAILHQHGATLQDLQLHEPEDSTGLSLRESFSAEELQSIRQSCPRLGKLTFDLNRVSWQLRIQDYDGILEELRKFKLDQIQIYLDSGLQWLRQAVQLERQGLVSWTPLFDIVDDEGPIQLEDGVCLSSACTAHSFYEGALPLTIERTDPAWAHLAGDDESFTVQPPSSHWDVCHFLVKVWKTIFGSHALGSRQIELKYGEWEKKSFPHDLYRFDDRDMRLYCRARPHERDDMVGKCFVEMDCAT
ncbi:uncharacterized protein Z520_00395 [Fonsecaea multimorphosa CBS 102226]|uniref:F-box domain-containing protein n=1 Tax=Fonsecaea multimorphosa CBS 102226 TaxID=1442371 RepID=A0A0D2L3R8_9EURO|nr:uncharacterized protein Z520_00395 [Fonsecaea multimorphosa CBS 102226]KIY03704.1 hypothetical protein Z520_00395 [Fonsecaea multimorphosa CBS 102226]OAL32404.1 hypothetical protein AYO22_00426 [Fonsecaea multimorphosa]